jgi:hypothetical protein
MSYDPSQPPDPMSGPHYEYGNYNPGNYNPYEGPQIPYESVYMPGAAPQQGAPSATPLPLGEAIEQLPPQWWKVLSKPGALTFAEEAGKASWDIIWVQLVGYAILAAILSALNAALRANSNAALMNQLSSSSTSSQSLSTLTTTSSPGFAVVTSLAGTLIGFFIAQGIYFGLAKAFGGQGTFTQQAYVFLLFQVPLGIVTGLLQFLPIAGVLVALAAGVYEIVLSVFAVMGVHRLSGGKASAVVLIPVGVVFLLLCCAIFFIVVAIANNPNVH